MNSGLYSAPLLRPGLSRNRESGAVPFQSVSQSVSVSVSVSVSSVQFSYAMKPGGPEWGKRRLWAAQGVFRAVQTGAKDLDLSAFPRIPGFTPLSCSDQALPGAGEYHCPISVSVSVQCQFSSVQFSYAMKPGGPEWGKRRHWTAQGVFRAVQTGAKDLDLSAAS